MKQLKSIHFASPQRWDASPSQGYPQECIAGTHFIHLRKDSQKIYVKMSMDSTINRGKPALVSQILQYIHVVETKRKEEVSSDSKKLALLVIQKWMAFFNIATRYSCFCRCPCPTSKHAVVALLHMITL